jgi:hypothetical protein
MRQAESGESRVERTYETVVKTLLHSDFESTYTILITKSKFGKSNTPAQGIDSSDH